MPKPYSANDKLRNLAQNLGFDIKIFDDKENLGPEIKLREKSKDGEIDAIMLYQNIVCLVGINKGKGDDINKEIEKFFEKLDKVDSVASLNLSLEITKKAGKKINDKKQAADALLKEVKDHITTNTSNYEMILVKMFFCPHKQLDEEFLRKARDERKIIIDKDTHEYFEAVCFRLNKECLFSDFIHFLNLSKIDLGKKCSAQIKKPGKSSPYRVVRLELEKDKIIMYSLPLRVDHILQYVTVFRMAQKYDKKGFQRMIKEKRLDKISREYLSENQTFPNNIIIALNPEIYKDEKDFFNSSNEEISLYDEFNSLIIIDGQHRFFSFVKGNKTDREVLVTLIFFKGQDQEENYLLMDKLFYKINKTQERLDPNLSFILEARIEPNSEANFWYEVFKKLDKKGFFANRFSFKESTLRKNDAKKSIISVIKYGGVEQINRMKKTKGISADGLSVFYSGNKQDNITFAFNLFKNYFDVIEKVLHQQKSIHKDKLSPREIGALVRLIRHFVITEKNYLELLGKNEDITKSKQQDHVKAVKHIMSILSNVQFKRIIESDLAPSNWAAVEGFMLKNIHKKKASFGNKNLLSRKGLEIYRKKK